MIKITPLIFVGIAFLWSCIDPVEAPEAFVDEDIFLIADYIEDHQDTYSKFYRVMIEGDLIDPLSAYNPFGNGFTLFLPTDEAFDRYIQNNDSYSSFEALIEDKEFVRVLGRYHLVNIGLKSNEFPYGALPDTTATGDVLTIGFSTSFDSTIYKVNNVASVTQPNLEMVNGYIHEISEVLKPINFPGVEWLQNEDGYSILSGALTLAGITDTLGIYRTTGPGQVIRNKYTILAEHDSIFQRNGIQSVDDLLERYNTPGLTPDDPDNQFFQFAAYHVLEGDYFLVDFEVTRNYNTYASAPVRIQTGLELRLNPGVDTFRLEISEMGDTTAIRHIGLFYQESDINSKTGPIHLIDQVLEYYIPPTSEQIFQFYEAPPINNLRNTQGTHDLLKVDQDDLEVITFTGPDEIIYYKTTSNSENAFSKDYIQINGNFTISYTIPKILPGKYKVYLRAHGFNRNDENATILVFMDGKQLGGSINLNSGGLANNPYNVNNQLGYLVGGVEFSNYKEHTVTVESFIPGRFIWDYIRFVPDK